MNGADESAGGYVHATAVVIGEHGVLIRGPSGSGKSRLASLLLAEAGRRGLFARLVADDRVGLGVAGARLLARTHPAIAGLMERRTEGILFVPHEPVCTIDRLIDLMADELPRLPASAAEEADLLGVRISRLCLPAGLIGIDAGNTLDRLLQRGDPLT